MPAWQKLQIELGFALPHYGKERVISIGLEEKHVIWFGFLKRHKRNFMFICNKNINCDTIRFLYLSFFHVVSRVPGAWLIKRQVLLYHTDE